MGSADIHLSYGYDKKKKTKKEKISPLYHTVMLAIVIVLYTTSVALIYLTTGSLHLLTIFLQFPLLPILLLW